MHINFYDRKRLPDGSKCYTPTLFFILALTLTTSFCANGGVTSSSLNSPIYLHTADPFGITQAIRSGNSKSLKTMSEAALPSTAHMYALAGYYRSTFQINRSSEYAGDCYDEALTRLPHTAVEAIRCGELLAGNDAISGRTSDWARTMHNMRDDLYSIAASSLHDTNIVFPGFGTIAHRIDMLSFYHFPDEKIDGDIGNNIVIPRVLASGEKPGPNAFKTGTCFSGIRCFGSVYYVNVSVNGHRITAVVDTGSFTSTVTSSEATTLGIHVNPSPYYWLQSTDSDHVPSHLGYADSIRIETNHGRDIVLRDSKVRVGGKYVKNVKMVLGLNAISRLGSVLLEKNRIVVHPNFSQHSCGIPLHIASDLFGSYNILFKYPIDGRIQNVVLDTGENQYLFGTSSADAKRSSLQTLTTHSERGTGDVNAMYYPARIEFGSGDHAKNLTIAVFPNYKHTYPYVMGADILQDYNILLDFDRGTACLLAR